MSLVLRSILSTALGFWGWAAKWWILGKCFIRVPLAHHQFCPNLCILVNFEPRQSVFPCNIWLRVLVHLTKTQYRIWEYVDFCALEIDDSFITNQRQVVPWRVFPVNCFPSIDLILFGHQFRRYVEHLFHCEMFCILDGMPIVWVILLHEYRCFQCWRHELSPCYRMFVAVFCCICWGCFCFFRTCSFTLCKNVLDPNEKFWFCLIVFNNELMRSLWANSWSFRSIVICFFLNDVLAVTREKCLRRSMWANNVSHRSIVHHFIRFPLLRIPSLSTFHSE